MRIDKIITFLIVLSVLSTSLVYFTAGKSHVDIVDAGHRLTNGKW